MPDKDEDNDKGKDKGRRGDTIPLAAGTGELGVLAAGTEALDGITLRLSGWVEPAGGQQERFEIATAAGVELRLPFLQPPRQEEGVIATFDLARVLARSGSTRLLAERAAGAGARCINAPEAERGLACEVLLSVRFYRDRDGDHYPDDGEKLNDQGNWQP